MIKGKMEGKIEVVKNALKEKMSVDVIKKLTGLTENEINTVKNGL